MRYTWTVLETYPDGFVWTHQYTSKQDALWGMDDLKAAHRGRTYTLVETQG